MKTFWVLAATVGVVLGLGAWGVGVAPSARADANHRGGHRSEAKPTPEEFNQAVRKLWEDHVTWTRLFIVSASADLPDLAATTNRLLENQQDIGDAIKPFYGQHAGEQLTSLLRQHILVAADVLTAAKVGDDAGVEAATDKWYTNADEIAGLLSDANPVNWPRATTKAMMREHLDLTLEEAVAHLGGRYEEDVTAYDNVHDSILHMADTLSDGIVAQFPKRFA